MNLFGWLLLGHLLGDWLLQNDWMALGKKEGLFTLAGIVHSATYTATILGILWLVDGHQANLALFLAASLILFISHWLLDGTEAVQHWMYFYGQGKREVVRIMIDQTLHLLVLGVLTVFMVGR